MRAFVGLAVLSAGCGGGSGDGPPTVDPDAPRPPIDGGAIDAPAMPDAPPMPVTIFESATIAPGPFRPLPAQSTNGEQLLGVRFTTTAPRTITGLGAHVYTFCFTCTGSSEDTQFMAIVPIDPETNLPTTVDLTADAIGYGVATIPYLTSTMTLEAAPPSTVFPTNFQLPAGTWGLVIGGGYYGTRLLDINLANDVDGVGDPQYFHYTFEDQQWWYGQDDAPDTRMFVIGY